MKLRKKKTGAIVECEGIVFTHCNALALNWEQYSPNVNSLAELNEEWEDYKPTEPLIKDEKIRKAVRAWAEAFNVDVAYLAPIGDGSKFVELFNEDSDGFERIAIPAENIKQEQCYTITELCGEEEEWVLI